MKNHSLIRTKGAWLVVAFAALLACPLAFANTSATLLLEGTVPGILDISVMASPLSSNLDLSTNAAFIVASVTERSNKRAGYTVTLSSANAAAEGASIPFLKGSLADNPDRLSYSLTYNTAPVALSGGSAIISDVSTKTPSSGSVKPLGISYVGEFLYEDTYSDTLTFTIAAK
jgi:hypothetical protein